MEWTAKLLLCEDFWGLCEVMWKHRKVRIQMVWEAGTPDVVFQCPVCVLCTWKQLGFPPGMPMSDQYVKLEEERRHKQKLEKDKKKKKQKKEKRGKHHRHNSLHTESEEDIAPAHHVDIITEEMPEVSSCGWGLGFIYVQLLRDFCPHSCSQSVMWQVQSCAVLQSCFRNDWDDPTLFFAGEEITVFFPSPPTKRQKLPLKLLKKSKPTKQCSSLL